MTIEQSLRSQIARYLMGERRIAHAGQFCPKPDAWHQGVFYGMVSMGPWPEPKVSRHSTQNTVLQVYRIFDALRKVNKRYEPM